MVNKSYLIKFNKFFLPFLLLFLVFFLVSCGSMKTNKDHFEKIDKFVNKRSFDTAATFLVAAKDLSYGEKDRVLYWLDLGLLYHYQGDFNNSNLMFENAEFAIDDLYTKSISKGAGSLLLNDNALDYSGEDYEDIYLNVFKCLNYLGLKKIDEAFVEIRRINEKLTLLEDKYAKITEEYNSNKDNKAEIKPGTSQFHNSALGRYLSYLLYRNENDIDGARIDKGKIDEAFSLQPELYNFSNPITDSIFLVPDTLVAINFISLFGKGPEKFAYDLVVHTDKDIIIIYSSDGQDKKQLDAINWPGVDKGLHFKLSLPRMEKKHSNVNRITIELDGKEVSEFKIIESIENVALDPVNKSAILNLYPNPSDGIINIETDRNYTVIVMDITGSVIGIVNVDSSTKTIDLSNRHKGLYILKFESDENTFETKVIVK